MNISVENDTEIKDVERYGKCVSCAKGGFQVYKRVYKEDTKLLFLGNKKANHTHEMVDILNV